VKLQHSVAKLQTLPGVGNFKLRILKFFMEIIEKIALLKELRIFPGGEKKSGMRQRWEKNTTGQ